MFFFFKSQKSNLLRKSGKHILTALCYGSGPVRVQTQRLPRTAPEPHRTPKRFAVWHECQNRTWFRFRVRNFSPSNQTALNLGIPKQDYDSVENKGLVVQGSRVQRRVQSSNWIEDERELDFVKR